MFEVIDTRLIDVLEYIGTFAFAISGIRLASAKQFDWFGAYVIGIATAIGGGTIRDLLLDIPPFWMLKGSYLICSAFALIIAIIFRKHLVKLNHTLFIFDTIGLSLFTIVGIEKTLACGYSFWVAITMGIITGCAGGIIRDVLINEVPLVFKKEIYAMASLLGGIIFYIGIKLNLNIVICELGSAVSIIIIRILAVKKQLSLPILKGEEDKNP